MLATASPAWAGLSRLAQQSDSPLALVVWLRSSESAAMLRELIKNEPEPSHESIPSTKSGHYLRSLLVELEILEERNEYFERLPEWVDTLLQDDPAEIQNIIQRFAQWHVLHRARRRSTRRELTEGSMKWTRQQITIGREFLIWLRKRQLEPQDCTQSNIDLWLASGNTRRYLVRDFIAWAQTNKIVNRNLKIPLRTIREATQPITEDDRWGTLTTILKDANIPDDVKVAATLTIAYGQHLSRVVALKTTSVTIREDKQCFITVAKTPLPLPGPLAEPLTSLVSEPNRGKASISRSNAGNKWLFPGGNPGTHITSEQLRKKLAQHGITLRETRSAALQQWALETPAPILATSLGLHINTAIGWRDSVQADYTDYIGVRTGKQQ
jgi:hypothetical protein